MSKLESNDKSESKSTDDKTASKSLDSKAESKSLDDKQESKLNGQRSGQELQAEAKAIKRALATRQWRQGLTKFCGEIQPDFVISKDVTVEWPADIWTIIWQYSHDDKGTLKARSDKFGLYFRNSAWIETWRFSEREWACFNCGALRMTIPTSEVVAGFKETDKFYDKRWYFQGFCSREAWNLSRRNQRHQIHDLIDERSVILDPQQRNIDNEVILAVMFYGKRVSPREWQEQKSFAEAKDSKYTETASGIYGEWIQDTFIKDGVWPISPGPIHAQPFSSPQQLLSYSDVVQIQPARTFLLQPAPTTTISTRTNQHRI
jgi:hypothetical protein